MLGWTVRQGGHCTRDIHRVNVLKFLLVPASGGNSVLLEIVRPLVVNLVMPGLEDGAGKDRGWFSVPIQLLQHLCTGDSQGQTTIQGQEIIEASV